MTFHTFIIIVCASYISFHLFYFFLCSILVKKNGFVTVDSQVLGYSFNNLVSIVLSLCLYFYFHFSDADRKSAPTQINALKIQKKLAEEKVYILVDSIRKDSKEEIESSLRDIINETVQDVIRSFIRTNSLAQESCGVSAPSMSRQASLSLKTIYCKYVFWIM